MRSFRGLVIAFALSFLNLAGVLLTVTAIGGLAPWSRWQFIGLFGALEAASGLANVVSPNLWRLPVAELQTSERTGIQLAASTLLLPHWGGLARFGAGVTLICLAGWQEGVGPATLGVVPFVALLAWLILAVSAAIARLGVARPDVDVFQLVVRWGGRQRELEPVSTSSAVFQFLLSIATIPAVKLLPPSLLYRPELAPSAGAMLAALSLSVALAVLVYALWAGRVAWSAPPEQQREAEADA